MEMCDQVNYDEKGLVPAIIQDYENGEVLMIAYMNKESLRRTVETGRTHFWSRSRQAFWEKGEHSGHVQVVKEVRIDCDNDALLIKVEQKVAACHAGYRSCFYRKWESEGWNITMEKIFDETQVY